MNYKIRRRSPYDKLIFIKKMGKAKLSPPAPSTLLEKVPEKVPSTHCTASKKFSKTYLLNPFGPHIPIANTLTCGIRNHDNLNCGNGETVKFVTLSFVTLSF